MIHPNETVRLVRELAEPPLPRYAEGTIVSMIPREGGGFAAVEVRFYRGAQNGPVTVTLPLDAVELVISPSSQHRTAVFWGINAAPGRLIESGMHFMLDGGFMMREGLNAVQLTYDEPEHWWKWGDKLSDPTGAAVATMAHTWDGCIAGFSGRERFDLEFHLAGREPVLLLHEREEAFDEQARETPPAMKLCRTLVNLAATIGAQYCAFPVATTWLFDQDWKSLLREPYYPDFYFIPQLALPEKVPDGFRVMKMTEGRAMVTALPVKFSPVEDPIRRTNRELSLASLRKCKALGEKYYDQLYETRLNPTGLYSSAKEAFYDAISLAKELGLTEETLALEKRLDHIKAVFRSQFT